MIIPFPFFRKQFSPKVIGLFFRAPYPEFYQTRKNLLQNALGFVFGRCHLPLGTDQTAHDQTADKDINNPDNKSHRRQL